MSHVICDGKEGRPLIPTWNDDGSESEDYLRIEETTLHTLKQIVYNTIRNNADYLIAIDGDEGSGKTRFSSHVGKIIAWYASKRLRRKIEFTAKNNYVYRSHEFINKAIELPHYTPIVFDEARSTTNRKRTLSNTNQKLNNFLAEMRESYHKFVIIVLPKFHDLDAYIAEHRCKLLFNFQYREKRSTSGNLILQAGCYNLFGEKSVRKIASAMRKGKKIYPRRLHKHLFYAHKNSAVDLKVLRQHKARITKEYAENFEPVTEDSIKKKLLFAAMEDEDLRSRVTVNDVCQCFGISHMTYYRWKNAVEED